MVMRIIAFKLWGDFAHFRRHFTTSSPLTHCLPPPSALRGLVGAIIGLAPSAYPEKLSPENCRLGVRLLKPIKKIRLSLNYLDTKDGAWVTKPPKGRLHTQVRVEFLKDPSFEVFFYHKDRSLMDEFSKRLKDHRTVYTPYLGISECLASFKFLWDEEVQPSKGKAKMISAFPTRDLEDLKLGQGVRLLREVIPSFIDAERRRCLSEEVTFSPYAEPIEAVVKEAFGYPQKRDEAFSFIG